MSSSHKKVLEDRAEAIVDNMEPSRVLNSLVAAEALSVSELEQIRSYLTTNEKNQQVCMSQ